MLELMQFLVAAKKATYAGSGDDFSLPSPFPESKLLAFSSGNYSYRDIYIGMTSFSGQEVVSFCQKPVWAMSYSGECIAQDDIATIYAFLRKALLQIPLPAPFRGPEKFHDSGLYYLNCHEGDMKFFSGTESITKDGFLMYRLNYSGGLLS